MKLFWHMKFLYFCQCHEMPQAITWQFFFYKIYQFIIELFQNSQLSVDVKEIEYTYRIKIWLIKTNMSCKLIITYRNLEKLKNINVGYYLWNFCRHARNCQTPFILIIRFDDPSLTSKKSYVHVMWQEFSSLSLLSLQG